MKSVLQALDVLVEYPPLLCYIKDFDSPGGFMYTIETDPQRIAYQKHIEELLDPTDCHSGASWACLLRTIQSVLSGQLTRAQVQEQIDREEIEYQNFNIKYRGPK